MTERDQSVPQPKEYAHALEDVLNAAYLAPFGAKPTDVLTVYPSVSKGYLDALGIGFPYGKQDYSRLSPEEKESADRKVADLIIKNEGLKKLITLLRADFPARLEEELAGRDTIMRIRSERMYVQRIKNEFSSWSNHHEVVQKWSDQTKRYALLKASALHADQLEAERAAWLLTEDTDPNYAKAQQEIAKANQDREICKMLQRDLLERR